MGSRRAAPWWSTPEEIAERVRELCPEHDLDADALEAARSLVVENGLAWMGLGPKGALNYEWDRRSAAQRC